MKLIDIVTAHNTIDGFADAENISAHLAYWMTKFVVKTQADAQFYAKEVQKIVDKYSVADADGKETIPADKIQEAEKELEDLRNTEVEDPGIKFALSELSSELKCNMKQMYTIMAFVDEEK